MSSSDTPKKVLLKGDPIRKEGVAGAAITPGMLVNYDANGNLVPHAGVGMNAAPTFALEQDFLGKDLDASYAIGDQVQVATCRPGDEIYALLDAGANVKKGDFLESNGAGALQAFSNQAYQFHAIVCRAAENKDNSGGYTPVRIRVEVV